MDWFKNLLYIWAQRLQGVVRLLRYENTLALNSLYSYFKVLNSDNKKSYKKGVKTSIVPSIAALKNLMVINYIIAVVYCSLGGFSYGVNISNSMLISYSVNLDLILTCSLLPQLNRIVIRRLINVNNLSPILKRRRRRRKKRIRSSSSDLLRRFSGYSYIKLQCIVEKYKALGFIYYNSIYNIVVLRYKASLIKVISSTHNLL
ncbi:hypothetical protein HDK77DRAFT_425242 [Phyllosticta capitalensis]